jgi:hypothetical protein
LVISSPGLLCSNPNCQDVAQPGALDTTYGGTGQVITSPGSNEYLVEGLAVQPDLKTVVVGYRVPRWKTAIFWRTIENSHPRCSRVSLLTRRLFLSIFGTPAQLVGLTHKAIEESTNDPVSSRPTAIPNKRSAPRSSSFRANLDAKPLVLRMAVGMIQADRFTLILIP